MVVKKYAWFMIVLVVVGGSACGASNNQNGQVDKDFTSISLSYPQSTKSLSTARRISTWSTLAPLGIGGAGILSGQQTATAGGIVLGGPGLIYGPSTGHVYAGNTGRVFSGSSLRILSIVGGLSGLCMMAAATIPDYPVERWLEPGLSFRLRPDYSPNKDTLGLVLSL